MAITLPDILPFPKPIPLPNGKPDLPSDENALVSRETWAALANYTLVVLGILIIVLAIEKIPRIGAPLLVLIVLGMLLTATNKGLI